MTDRVVVRAPATVANLGPGYDVLGLSLGWYDEVRAERHDALEITASGIGAEGVKRDESNGVVRAMIALLGETPAVRLHKLTAVSFGRGFGSSAIGFVAGLVAARALFDTGHTDDELLRVAVELEGHPDNVAPCLLGGVTVCAADRVVRLEPPPGLRVIVCVAPTRLPTEEARRVVPETYSRSDALFNSGRVAMLTAALATDRTDVLLEATDDVFHQPARFELMPDSAAVVRTLRAQGMAAFLSGAGPSVAAFVRAEDGEAMAARARQAVADGWDVRVETIDAQGATVVERR